MDVLKLEVPINMKFVEGTKSFKGEKAYTKAEAQDLFRKSAEATNKPFIYLSAGVSNAEFSETLELVGESGVKYNGVLCGRATWADGVPIFAEKGLAAFREWLEVRRREEHRKRKRRTKSGFAVVADLRGVSAIGSRLVGAAARAKGRHRNQRFTAKSLPGRRAGSVAAVAVEDMVLVLPGGVDDLVRRRDLKERGWLIATADLGDRGGELASPGVAVQAAHHEFEIGRKPLLADDVDGSVIADLSGGQGGDDARTSDAEAEDDLLAEILRAHRVRRSEKWLIDAHG